MRNGLAICLSVIVTLSFASSAWSQNPITADSPFQIRYFSNLNLADSVINITNSGANGNMTGNICANVYVFSPDEQMAACCSCLVTPNALVSLSVRNDLISNTLTPAVPNSVVVKLVSTLAPAGGSCNATKVLAPDPLVPGLLAWGTTFHQQTTTITVPNTSSTCKTYCQGGYPQYASWCNTYCPARTQTTTSSAVTETPFSPATLSAGELFVLTDRCTDIQQDGSGFGICKSCRLGGQ